jgi:hypothetical protein
MTWVAAMLGLTLAVLTASILLVVFRGGSRRAYWIGFATVGWLYLLLVVVSWTLARMASDDNPLRAHNLITQQLASVTYHWLYDKAFEKYHGSVSGPYSGVMGNGQAFYFGTTPPSDPAGAGTGGMSMDSGMAGSTMPVTGPMPIAISFATPTGPPPGPNESDFVNVAHALWTLLLAVIGGWVAYWLYMTSPGRTERQASVSS